MANISDKSLIRYPGGKFRARKILEEMLPENVETILSPFFGGGSFELYMTGKGKKVIANDKFLVLANFWEQVLLHPAEIGKRLETYLGTIDKDIFREKQRALIEINNSGVITDPIDSAVEFFIVNRCSFSGITLSGGFSKESSISRFTPSIVKKVSEFHNPNLQIKYGDCHEVLKGVPENVDFLFLDPPYLLEEEKNNLYGVAGNMHKFFDHHLFKKQIDNIDTPFLITYNNDEVIRDLWKDYNIYETSWSYGMNKDKKSSELVITNYEVS